MERQFTTTIRLGNNAMRTSRDVADALEKLAAKLRGGHTAGRVLDVNGNSVGEFSIEGQISESEARDS